MGGKLLVVAHIAHPPVAPPRALTNENVIQVNVRPHAAAGRGVADHHVVKPPLGDEGKRLHQLRHLGRPVVHGLHHQRPARVTQMVVFFKRPAFGLPLPVFLVNQTRLHFFL